MASGTRQTEPGQDATRKAAEQTAQTGRTMTDSGERMTRAAADAAQRSVDGMSKTWQDNSEAASRIAERSMDQYSKMLGVTGESARQMLQNSTGNVQAVMEGTTAISDGFQQMSAEWMRFAQNSIEQNLKRFEQLQGCRGIPDLMALQTQIVRDNLEALLETARRTSELSTRHAEEAARRMSDSTLAPR